MSKYYVLLDSDNYLSEIRYVFDVLFSIYGHSYRLGTYEEASRLSITSNDIIISYGKSEYSGLARGIIHVYKGKLFGKGYLSKRSLPCAPVRWHAGVPIIYKSDSSGQWIVESAYGDQCKRYKTKIDMIASAFFMLTRYEEYVNKYQDVHGRYPAKQSIAYKEGFLNVAVVNRYADIIWNWIQSIDRTIQRKYLWEPARFAACLTYDIDRLTKYKRHKPRELARLLFRDPDISTVDALSCIWSQYVRDPFNTFSSITRTHKKFNGPETYYLKSGGKAKYDQEYHLDSKELNVIYDAVNTEIGLHGSYDSFDKLNLLVREKRKLEKATGLKVSGIRQHYLRWANPITWQIQAKSGFMYDSTLAYADYAGFRCGMALPYQPYDLENRKTIDIWELPPTVMDGSLFQYQDMSLEQAYNYTKSLIDEVELCRGVFIMIWHNSSLNPEWKKVYINIIRYLRDKNAHLCCPRYVIEQFVS